RSCELSGALHNLGEIAASRPHSCQNACQHLTRSTRARGALGGPEGTRHLESCATPEAAWARGSGITWTGEPMGGCAQPTTLPGFFPRCCVGLTAGAMMSLGLAAQAAPATKRAQPAAAPQPTQTQAAQPRRVRVVHRVRPERSDDRGSSD